MKFWVDPLCIDQNNLLEKNRQVSLMGEIYARFVAVVVWLEEMDESNKAIDIVTQIGYVSLEQIQLDRPCGGGSERGLWSLWVKESYGQWFSEVPWMAIYMLICRTSWERLWIIQELSLNSNKTLFLCGNRRLS